MFFLNKQDGGKADNSSGISSDVSHDEDESSHNHEEESLSVLSGKKEDVRSVSVKNSKGSFTLDNPLSGKANLTIDKLSGINQNETLVKSMLENSANLEAEKLVEENAEDMGKYGLKKPCAQFTVKYADDTEKTVLIGDESVDGNSRYLKVSDEKKVYLVKNSKVTYYTDDYTSFVSNSIFPQQDQNQEYGRLTISRTDLKYDMVFEDDPTSNTAMASSQVMTSPVFAYLDVNISTDITHGMWGLTASGCEAVKPDEKTLKKYGLDKPVCTVNFKGDDYNYTLNVGNPIYGAESGSTTVGEKEIYGYYCTVSGNSGTDCIYRIALGNLPWVTVKADEIKSDVIIARFLADLDSITLSGEKNFRFSLESTGTSEENADTKSVTLDGKELDVENFKTFYQGMIACPSIELCFDEPKAENKYLTVELHAKNGEKQILEFYKDTSRRTIMKNNGKTSYRIENTWVQTLMDNAQKVVDGKKIS